MQKEKYTQESLEYLYKSRLERAKKPKNLFKISITLILFLSLCIVFWYLYDRSLDKAEGEIIIINADNQEIKVKPLNPGGMVVDNMDKSVYNVISEQNNQEQEEVKILPPAEEPIDKNIIILEDQEQEAVTQTQTNKIDTVLVLEETPSPVKQKTTQPEQKPEKKPEKKFYKVQIAAFKSHSDAEKEWKHLSRKFPKLIGLHEHYIATKEIEGKGTFYRLQIGPFEKEKDASKACKQLKESNVNCFIVKP